MKNPTCSAIFKHLDFIWYSLRLSDAISIVVPFYLFISLCLFWYQLEDVKLHNYFLTHTKQSSRQFKFTPQKLFIKLHISNSISYSKFTSETFFSNVLHLLLSHFLHLFFHHVIFPVFLLWLIRQKYSLFHLQKISSVQKQRDRRMILISFQRQIELITIFC